MKSSGSRLLIFILGICIGLLAGAGFFIFKVDQYIEKMELFKPRKDTLLISGKSEKSGKPSKGETENKTTNYNAGEKKSGNSNSNADTINQVLNQPGDSKNTKADTMGYSYSEDQIVVRKDELIDSRVIQIKSLDSEPKNPKDSALQELAGIKEGGKSNVLTLEIWKSPVNYKGYKLLKGKAILFGINPAENYQVFRYEGQLFIRWGQGVFRLEPSQEFRSFERVLDPALVSRFH